MVEGNESDVLLVFDTFMHKIQDKMSLLPSGIVPNGLRSRF
jgi:hypothetical protein